MLKTSALVRALLAVAVSVSAVAAVAGIASAGTASGPGAPVSAGPTASIPATDPTSPAPTLTESTDPAPTATSTPMPTCEDECGCPAGPTPTATPEPTLTSTVGAGDIRTVAYRRAGKVTYTFTIELKAQGAPKITVVAKPKEESKNIANEEVFKNGCLALRFESAMRKDCTFVSIAVDPKTIKLESDFVAKVIDDPLVGEIFRYWVKFQNQADPTKPIVGTVTIVITCPTP